jgi:hypothetical protein
MSEDVSLATRSETSAPTALAIPTGYRVGIVPGAIEVSARLGTPEEIRELIKVLRAGILTFTTDGDVDIPESFSHRVAAVRAASLKQK